MRQTLPAIKTLVYSIGGPDAGYFKIGGSLADLEDPDDADSADGELRAKDELDFEDNRKNGSLPDRITYNITVTATDPFGATSAAVPVKITVTDVLENADIRGEKRR